MFGHEIDRFRRDLLGRDDQVALVLAIGVIRHDDHAALGDIADHIVNRVELKRLFRLDDHRATSLMVGRASVEPTNLARGA